MPDYDFLNLSPPEFEDLTRDLLQKEYSIRLESFTSGRDQGIDLRYSANRGNTIVVQCKRYQDFTSLYNNLKKEVGNLTKLNPEQYLISTSVGLTPHQKDQILKLLAPYIKSTSDILGRDDLNNLLGKYHDVEKQHFKLWLSSTNVLQTILKSKIVNQSNFEEEKIRETTKLYVENSSYFKATEIIKDRKYVIISGIPGIGKTTLARILVYHYLALGFDEFVFLSDSINEGYDFYKENVKQIFLFDDFLGRNFLDKKLSTNEEKRIVTFIEKVSSSNDKILILTTREYILTQAKQQYDVFTSPKLEFAKCVIDLSQYTKIVRAKILFNHLYFSAISKEYLDNLIDNKGYNLIINHQNYNPRIIETITNDDIWKNIEPKEFTKKFKLFLDNPTSVWKHVYENQISEFSKCLLANMLTMGSPVLIDDLKRQLKSFSNAHSTKYSIVYNEQNFKKSIKELENTFIRTKKDAGSNFAVGYQNPSVQDFLVNHLRENEETLEHILQSTSFYNQFFTIFSYKENTNGTFVRNKIQIPYRLQGVIIDHLVEKFYDLESSEFANGMSFESNRSTYWRKKRYSTLFKLNELLNSFNLNKHKKLKNFLIQEFNKEIIPTDLEDDDFQCYTNLLEELKGEYEEIDETLIIEEFSKNLYEIDQVEEFEKLEYIFPSKYIEFTEHSESFKDKILELISKKTSDTDEDNEVDLEDTLDKISSIGDKFCIDYSSEKKQLEEFIETLQRKAEVDNGWDDDDRQERFTSNEDLVIDNMFDYFKS